MREQAPRGSRREPERPPTILLAVKVILPDESELELPDGATGLDAARAIGPKLAEQAVLVQGRRRGAGRAAAAPRRRAAADPDDAGHARPRRARRAAPLRRAPARRGGAAAVPRREGRDRAADRERVLLRLRVPDADQRRGSRGDRGRGAARARRGAHLGAQRSRPRRPARASRRRASRTSSSRRHRRRARSRSTRRASSPISAAGPHLQGSAPIKAFKLTSLAGAYWRGDEQNTQLTRIYGTAFYSRRTSTRISSGSSWPAPATTARLGPQLDLFHLQDASPGSPFWHPVRARGLRHRGARGARLRAARRHDLGARQPGAPISCATAGRRRVLRADAEAFAGAPCARSLGRAGERRRPATGSASHDWTRSPTRVMARVLA